MMWHVSPVAWGPTMRLVETTFAVNGALFLYVFTGMVDWSQYGSASRKSCLAEAGAALMVAPPPPVPLPSYDRRHESSMLTPPTRDIWTRLAGAVATPPCR